MDAGTWDATDTHVNSPKVIDTVQGELRLGELYVNSN